MLDYLLKSGVCLAVFYLFYKLLLEKEPIHIFKRIYLLSGLVLAFAIPLITFTTVVEIDPVEFIPYSFSEIPFEQQITQEVSTINYWPIILWTVYGFGIVVFSLKFLLNLYKIGSKIRKNTKQKVNQFTHVLLQNLSTPHTFLSYIFLNKQRYLQHQIPQEVFWHEETHAKQKHSFDVVFLELLQVVFWFNPLLYFIKKDIKLNHEFLADSAVLNKGVSLTVYQEILLAFSSNQTEPLPNNVGMANALNYSSIKKRFTIMKTQPSKKAVWIKSLILLPLVAVLIYSFSEQKVVEIEKSNDILTQNINSTSKIKDIEIFINKYDNLLANEVETTIGSLEKRLYEINPDISFKNRQNIIVNIYTNVNTKKGIITDIKNISRNYGIVKMNIDGVQNVTLQNRLYPISNFQDKATPEEIAEYNKLAKKYNAQPENKRHVKLKDLNRLKYIFNKMTVKQKENAEPFPSFSPPPPPVKTGEKVVEGKPLQPPKKMLKTNTNKNIILLEHWYINIDGRKLYYPYKKGDFKKYYDKYGNEVTLNIVKEYQKKNANYKSLKNEGKHYVYKSDAKKRELEQLSSDLGGMYFRMSKTNKAKVKRSENLYYPYIKLTKRNGEVYYKKRNELTEEDKKLLPLPPPPPAKN